MIAAQKIVTVCRLARSPHGHPRLWRQSFGKFLGAPSSLEETGPQAVRWCRRKAVSRAEVLHQLGLGNFSDQPLETREPGVFARARAAVERCPDKMGGAAHLTLLHDLTRLSGARSVLETGVAYGWSSLAVLLALRDRPGSMLVSTNLCYREHANDQHVGCAVPQELRARWTIIPRADTEAVPEAISLLSEGVDLCHYDSDKSYEGRLSTYTILWNALKPEGIFVSDDIQDNLAFAHFARMADAVPQVTSAETTDGGSKYVGILQKSHSRPVRPFLF